jgi:hypothetical protein
MFEFFANIIVGVCMIAVTVKLIRVFFFGDK